MLEVVSWFVVIILTYLVDCFIFCKLFGKSFFLSMKHVFLIIIAAIINCYFQQNYSMEIRMIVTNFELICLLKLIYNKSIVKILIAVLLIVCCYTISELIYVISTVLILKIDQVIILESVIGNFFSNIAILIITLLIFKFNKVVKKLKNIINWYKDNDFINTITLVIIASVTILALLYPISVHSYSLKETILFIIFLLCTIVFVTGFFTQKSKNDELSTEYDYLLDYVKVYEKELNDKAKIQHEYKNQLVLIKDMVTSKKAIKYIENLLDENSDKKNIGVLNSLKVLPTGGLKGLIYFKISRIKFTDVEIHINISNQLKKKSLWKTCIEELNDVSKIVGIFLDNSIEALEKEKEKYLILDIDYENDQLIFSFSNTCTKHIDFNKMEQEGYSTKGKNHGYGLSLVNDIVNSNSLLNIGKEINGKFFVQHLYINKKK